MSAWGAASGADRHETWWKVAQGYWVGCGMTHASLVEQWAVVGQDILVGHELIHVGGHDGLWRVLMGFERAGSLMKSWRTPVRWSARTLVGAERDIAAGRRADRSSMPEIGNAYQKPCYRLCRVLNRYFSVTM